MKSVVNTAKYGVHPEWVMGGNPRAIEAQEKEGQRQLVERDVIPNLREDDKAALEARGVVFGEAVPDDPLFIFATLPSGWQKRPTEHDMHSELVDADGVVVATMFYKAAFYDRKAFTRLEATP